VVRRWYGKILPWTAHPKTNARWFYRYGTNARVDNKQQTPHDEVYIGDASYSSISNENQYTKNPHTELVDGFNPVEKYARQIGSFPQVGVKIKDIETFESTT